MEKRYDMNFSEKTTPPYDVNFFYPMRFYNLTNTTEELIKYLAPGGTKGLYKDMSYMFSWCKSLTSIPNIDTRNVTRMDYMFEFCSNLTSIPNIDTRNVTRMDYMFSNCSNLTSIPNIDTSKVTNMGGMFQYCRNLTTIPLLDTSKVTNMKWMFFGCTALTTIPLYNTKSVTDMSSMFNGCSNIETIHMININTDLDIHWCNKMQRSAIVEVINNLVAQTSGTKTLTLGATLKGRITSEDIAIATNKGWTIV